MKGSSYHGSWCLPGRESAARKNHARWSGQRSLARVEVADVETVETFRINRRAYSKIDNRLPVREIERVKAS